MPSARGAFGMALFVMAMALAGPLFAQNRAAAEALFQAGRAALAKGDYATACEKFAESQPLDPAVGTLFNLAECNDKLGKLATAWQLFNQVADTLADNDPRKNVARERSRQLESRLPKLVLRLDPTSPPGSVVTL